MHNTDIVDIDSTVAAVSHKFINILIFSLEVAPNKLYYKYIIII
jgi:hypothetical protein